MPGFRGRCISSKSFDMETVFQKMPRSGASEIAGDAGDEDGFGGHVFCFKIKVAVFMNGLKHIHAKERLLCTRPSLQWYV